MPHRNYGWPPEARDPQQEEVDTICRLAEVGKMEVAATTHLSSIVRHTLRMELFKFSAALRSDVASGIAPKSGNIPAGVERNFGQNQGYRTSCQAHIGWHAAGGTHKRRVQDTPSGWGRQRGQRGPCPRNEANGKVLGTQPYSRGLWSHPPELRFTGNP